MTQAQRQKIKDRLETIREKNGGTITPDLILKDAKNASSPLHTEFSWDDAKAAHAHRLDQARELLRSFRVEVVTTTRTIMAPAYIRDPRAKSSGGEDRQGYTTIAAIRDEKEVARESMMYELSRAITMLERAVDIAESLGLGQQVADLVRQAKVVQDAAARIKTKGKGTAVMAAA